MTSKPMTSKPSSAATANRPFQSSLRAFIAECRIGCSSTDSWHNFAEQVIGVCTSEKPDLIHSALTALEKSKQDTSPKPLNSTCYNRLSSKLGSIQDADPDLCRLFQRTFDVESVPHPTSPSNDAENTDDIAQIKKEGKKPISSEDVIVIDDDSDEQITKKRSRPNPNDGNDEIEIVRFSTTAKRPRHHQQKTHQLTSKSSDIRRTDDYHQEKNHLRPAFGFHLLKTVGVKCEGDAYLSLHDVIPCGGTLAVICNFVIDIEWFWNHAYALETFEKVLIIHGGSAEEERRWRAFLHSRPISTTVLFVRPQLPSYGTMHSKMFLLFYGNTGCRVCIHSANLIEGDWRQKTQAAYMRDFPPAECEKIGCDFQTQLIRYMNCCLRGNEETEKYSMYSREVRQAIEKIDFSSAGAAIVSSVPGKHGGETKNHFGHLRLRHVLKENVHGAMDMPQNGTSMHHESEAVICQFSSLGSIQEKWLTEEFGESLSAQRCGKKIRKGDDGHIDIKLVYPTVEQVSRSNEGIQAGMSIPVREKNLRRDHITSRLCTWDASVSNRQRAMPHMKSFMRYRCLHRDNDDNDVEVSWLMIGSFNLSVAAWGRLQSKGTKLKILSYEFGVVFCPELYRDASFVLPHGVLKYSVSNFVKNSDKELRRHIRLYKFDAHPVDDSGSHDGDVLLPIPYRVPPTKYNSKCDIPWTIEHLEKRTVPCSMQ